MKNKLRYFLACVLLLVFVQSAYGGIFEYQNYTLKAKHYIWDRFTFFTPETSPISAKQSAFRFLTNTFTSTTPVPIEFNSTSFAFFNLTFTLLDPLPVSPQPVLYPPSLTILLMPASALHNFFSGSSSLCQSTNGLVNPDLDRYAHVLTFDAPETKPFATITRAHSMHSATPYYYFIVHCGVKGYNPNSVSITGEIYLKNPYGYQPGDTLGYRSFYPQLSTLYLFGFLIWLYLLIRTKKFVGVKLAIGLLFGVGVLYTWSVGFSWEAYNSSGRFHYEIILLITLLEAIMGALGRFLVLYVSYGFGVTQKGLAQNGKILVTSLLGAFTAVYGLVSWSNAYDREKYEKGIIDDQFFSYRSVWLPVLEMMMDLILLWFIFTNLFRSIHALSHFDSNLNPTEAERQRQQREVEVGGRRSEKIRMYWWVVAVISTSVFVGSVVNVLQLIMKILSWDDYLWKMWWMWPAFWELLFFVVLCVIGFVWRPLLGEEDLKYTYVMLEDSAGMANEIEMESRSSVEGATRVEESISFEEEEESGKRKEKLESAELESDEEDLGKGEGGV